MTIAERVFLVVGLGSIGQRHVRNLRRLGAKRILAVRSGHGVRPVPSELGVESYAELDHALACEPTVGLVCNPTGLHVETAGALVRAGLDVLIEKPISHTREGVDDLLRVAREQSRLLFVAYPWRFHPLVATTKEWVTQGKLGPIRYARAAVGQFPPAWAPEYDYRRSYAVRRDLGGGCVRTFIHEIDLLLYLLGRPRSVLAVADHVSSLETDVEDIAEIIYCYDGCVASVHIDYVQRSQLNNRYLQLAGEKASLWLDFSNHELRVADGSGTLEERRLDGFDLNEVYVDELRHFIECVDNRSLPAATGEDGADGLICALAAMQASSSGQRVNLTWGCE